MHVLLIIIAVLALKRFSARSCYIQESLERRLPMRSLRVTATVSAFVPFVFLAMLVLWTFVPAAFGAGGGFPDPGNSLGGSIRINNDLSYGSNLTGRDDYYNGNFSMSLNPNKVSFDRADWSFYTNSWDTSWWNASCYIHGLRNSSENWPQNESWSQSLDQGALHVNEQLYFDCREYTPGGPGGLLGEGALAAGAASIQSLTLSGNFSIEPSRQVHSNFRYWEGTDNRYDWPNGWDQPPVITQIPSWTAEFTMSGQFVAPILAEAQAMGAPFAKEVPEPGTWAMLLSGAVGIALAVRRRLI